MQAQCNIRMRLSQQVFSECQCLQVKRLGLGIFSLDVVQLSLTIDNVRDLTLVGIDKRLAYRSCLLIKDCCFCIESTSHEVISSACQQLKSCRARQLPALDMFKARLAMRQAALAE